VKISIKIPHIIFFRDNGLSSKNSFNTNATAGSFSQNLTPYQVPHQNYASSKETKSAYSNFFWCFLLFSRATSTPIFLPPALSIHLINEIIQRRYHRVYYFSPLEKCFGLLLFYSRAGIVGDVLNLLKFIAAIRVEKIFTQHEDFKPFSFFLLLLSH
jgi:hypothetical protein